VRRRTPAAAAAEGLPDEEKKNRCAAGRGASEVAKWAAKNKRSCRALSVIISKENPNYTPSRVNFIRLGRVRIHGIIFIPSLFSPTDYPHASK